MKFVKLVQFLFKFCLNNIVNIKFIERKITLRNRPYTNRQTYRQTSIVSLMIPYRTYTRKVKWSQHPKTKPLLYGKTLKSQGKRIENQKIICRGERWRNGKALEDILHPITQDSMPKRKFRCARLTTMAD